MENTQKTDSLPTPIHVIDMRVIHNNIEVLKVIKKETGCKILFAVKGFSCDPILSVISNEVDGFSASSVFEVMLARSYGVKYVQVHSPAIKKTDDLQLSGLSDCVILNSISQWRSFHDSILKSHAQLGIRINPEYSIVENYKVDPCHQYSRFGIRSNEINLIDLSTISGVLFHNMCEHGAEELSETLRIIGEKFANLLHMVKWVNIGGGQLFTDENYDIKKAIIALQNFQDEFDVDLYMEPCTAIMYKSGCLLTSVVDCVKNGMETAILDASAICHLPDIVNFPYRSEIRNAYEPFERQYTYRLAGPSCYSGDIFGDYSFDEPLQVGDKLQILDTAQYSMVKSIWFNGIPLPSVAVQMDDQTITIVKQYSYKEYKEFI